MAEINVMVLLNKLTYLLGKPDNLLIFEADQVRQIHSQLEYVLTFLVKFEGTKEKAIRKELVDEIGNLTHEAEGLLSTIEPPAPDINHLLIHLEEIRNRIRVNFGERYEHKSNLKLNEPIQAPSQDDEPVGLSGKCELLLHDLTLGYGRNLEVIPISGEGGSGKTTLAKKVYNHVQVTRHFTCRVWITVSREYRLRNLLLEILHQFMIISQDIYNMDEWELRRQILKQLENRRFLVVVDDVWTAEAWDELKNVFPKAKMRSRVLLTTRSINVAKRFGTRVLSGCGPLNRSDSYHLFSKFTFGDEICPDNLTLSFSKLLDYCQGLPIVIVVVASILRASEKTRSRWDLLVSRLGRQPKFRHPVLRALSVFYGEMPQHLKTCFLYLGVFPEDMEISVKQLIQLWIAEGLLPWVENARSSGSSMEDLAEGYLKELVTLKLVQVTKRKSNGDPKSIRIHDFIRELCITLSRYEKFVEVYGHLGKTSPSDYSSQNKPWVVSIVSNLEKYMVSSTTCSNNSSHVRSFSCFSHDAGNVSKEDWASLLQKFPLLRVLNLGLEEVRKLPNEATRHLSHLKYIKVRAGVTKSVFKLWNLQTIDLRTSQFGDLPKDIWKMQQLRHLYTDGSTRLPKADESDDQDGCCLPNLQTLSSISIDPEDEISKKAPNLKKLGLYSYQSSSGDETTFNLPQLQSLKFAEECTFEVPIKFPTTITKVTLKKAPIKPEVIKIFGDLPCLQILKLVQTTFGDDKLVFGEDSFPQLQLLKFEESNLVSWKLEKGALQKLRRLVFIKCPLLSEPQPGLLQELTSLEELEFIWTSLTFVEELNKEAERQNKKGLKIEIYPPLPHTMFM